MHTSGRSRYRLRTLFAAIDPISRALEVEGGDANKLRTVT
jgi:hypothetical protein